jgi:hypothetical protein
VRRLCAALWKKAEISHADIGKSLVEVLAQSVTALLAAPSRTLMKHPACAT